MGVLKNDVGRPSNKTIMIRRILKVIFLLIILASAVLIGYYAGNKNEENSNKKELNDNLQKEKITTTTKQEKLEYFDKSRITTIEDKNDDAIKYLYVYDKKIDIGAAIIDLGKVETMKDIAIIELLTAPDSVLIVVNTNGDILYNTMSQNNGVYCTNKTSECKEFEIDNNKVYYYLENLGQDVYNVCETFYNKEVLAKYEVTYEDKKISAPTKISSVMTGKDYIQKHNIDCSR